MSETVRVLCLLGCLAALVSPVAAAPSDERIAAARAKLLSAMARNDPKGVTAATQEFVGVGGSRSMWSLLYLLDTIPESEDATYWTIIEGASSYRDEPAMKALGSFIVRNAGKAVARDLLFGLSRSRSRHSLWALALILKYGRPDLQVLAVRKMASVPRPESVDYLIRGLRSELAKEGNSGDAELIIEIGDALAELTGQTFGSRLSSWEEWWARHRTAPLGVGAPESDRRSSRGITVVDSLRRRRKGEFADLESAPAEAVVVLSAIYEKPVVRNFRNLNNDRIENVLRGMKVSHTVVRREDFADYSLDRAGALIINCAQFHRICTCPDCEPDSSKLNRLARCSGCDRHQYFSAELSRKEIDRIVDFVSRGGFVFAEDWVVREILERAFRGYVRAGKVLRSAGMPDVDVVPARGRVGHPYLRGIFVPDRVDAREEERRDEIPERGRTVVARPKPLVQVKHRWSIDDESWAFQIRDESRVLVLLTSGELQAKTGGQGVVALAFRPGGRPEEIGLAPGERRDAAGRTVVGSRSARRSGVVLLVLSHFGKQGSTRDEFLLQNLLVNFLIDANLARQERLGPDRERARPAER